MPAHRISETGSKDKAETVCAKVGDEMDGIGRYEVDDIQVFTRIWPDREASRLPHGNVEVYRLYTH